MTSINLKTVEARNKLKPRNDIYFITIRTGCSLGFRKLTPASVGTWVARCHSEVTGKPAKRSLGNFEALPPSQRYDAALQLAEDFFKLAGVGITSAVKTVGDACDAYVEHIRTSDGQSEISEKKAKETKARFDRWVVKQPIAKIALSKLTMRDVEKWRTSVVVAPVVINPHAEANKQVRRTRSLATVNRDISPLRAALNHAHRRGNVASDVAWLDALSPAKGVDKARDIYLTKDQRRALRSKAPADLKLFIEGLCLLPLRPGALAALTTSSFDKELSVLTIGKDKSGRDRKIDLPTALAALIKGLCENKSADSPIFARSDGKAWNKDVWKKLFKPAAEAADLPSGSCTYSLRHSTITDLVLSGLDLLTIAQLSGTSVAMIEKHYGHLRRQHAKIALETLTL